MVFMLSTLTPESTYMYEAVIMLLLGAGLGVVMPVMNLAVQNEFKQHELGAATSSSQLFRSLGSTVGVAVFGAMLTAGITSGLNGVQDNAYIQTLKQNPEASKMGDFNDSNTLLNLNMPDTKEKITDGFEQGIEKLPSQAQAELTKNFKQDQDQYSDKVTHAFSDSLNHIFRVSAVLMLMAAVLVFALKEKPLHAAKPDQAPGIA
jgi:hypothetical protein